MCDSPDYGRQLICAYRFASRNIAFSVVPSPGVPSRDLPWPYVPEPRIHFFPRPAFFSLNLEPLCADFDIDSAIFVAQSLRFARI